MAAVEREAIRASSPSELPLEQGTLYELDADPCTFSDAVAPERPADAAAPVVEAVMGGEAMLVHGFLTPEECKAVVAGAKGMGYVAPGTTFRAMPMRSSSRLVTMGGALSDALWSRFQPHLEAFEGGRLSRLVGKASVEQLGFDAEGDWEASGLNECLRLSRYTPGGHFAPHTDGSFRRSDDERSALTFLVYLNDGMSGGCTHFLREDAELHTDDEGRFLASKGDVEYAVEPEVGMLLIFRQRTVLHEGGLVHEGVKHILRSDVMFRRAAASKPARSEREAEALSLVERAGRLEASGDNDGAVAAYRRAFWLWPDVERMLSG